MNFQSSEKKNNEVMEAPLQYDSTHVIYKYKPRPAIYSLDTCSAEPALIECVVQVD